MNPPTTGLFSRVLLLTAGSWIALFFANESLPLATTANAAIGGSSIFECCQGRQVALRAQLLGPSLLKFTNTPRSSVGIEFNPVQFLEDVFDILRTYPRLIQIVDPQPQFHIKMENPEPCQQEVAGVAEVQITAGGWGQPATPVDWFRAVRREHGSDRELPVVGFGVAP